MARALPPRAITRATALKVRQFISSGDANQTVSDNGRFRRLFIDALDGKEPVADPNGDGFITGTELGLFLSDKITNLSEKGQTPRYGKLIAEGFDRGDFVLEKGQIELPKVAMVSEAPQTPPPSGVTRSSAAEAQAAWAMAKQSTSITSIEAFRQQFGKENPFYDQVATERIAALKDETAKKETAERAAKETAERNERENAAAEEQRKAEDAKAAAEAKRKAEETRVAMLVKEDEARIAKETAEADAATEALRKSNEAAAAEAKRRVDAVEQMRRDVLALEDARKHDVSVADAKRKADQAKSETERLQLSMLAKEDEDRKAKEAAEATKPGRVFRDCEDKDSAGHYICPEMVVVPAGEFLMGSPENEEGHDDNEGPQHTVKIAKPFAVGKLEITFAEWDACSDCRYQPKDEGWGRGNRPVINVSWDDAKQYVGWLATKTGKPYRLLSEAEWEYAARAGTTTPFSFGGTITPEQANFIGNYTYGGSAKGEYRLKTILAGSFKPNAFGLHDMHGNVWEWVEDCYKDSYQSASTDGSTVPVVASCFFRVLRGGSWYNYPRDLRAAYRYMSTPVDRISHLGFRVARSLD